MKEEYKTGTIYPDMRNIFNALKASSFKDTKVVILGQDPYHGENQAHGLAFSVQPKVKIPPSLLNMYKELNSDIGCFIPNNGYLVPWANQGVLLLNTVLTVRSGEPNSHKGKGCEIFTDKIIIWSCTAFKLLLYPAYNSTGLEGIQLTQAELTHHIGPIGGIFVAVCILLFAFSSIVGNYYYGESNMAFCNIGKKTLNIFTY